MQSIKNYPRVVFTLNSMEFLGLVKVYLNKTDESEKVVNGKLERIGYVYNKYKFDLPQFYMN